MGLDNIYMEPQRAVDLNLYSFVVFGTTSSDYYVIWFNSPLLATTCSISIIKVQSPVYSLLR